MPLLAQAFLIPPPFVQGERAPSETILSLIICLVRVINNYTLLGQTLEVLFRRSNTIVQSHTFYGDMMVLKDQSLVVDS